MSKLGILNDARQDWKTARRERGFSVPAVLAVFFLIDFLSKGEGVNYLFVISVTLIVYCLLSIRLAVYATGLRSLMVAIDEKDDMAKEDARSFLFD